IPTSDSIAMMVAERPDELRQWFDFPFAGAGLVRAFCNKREMYRLALKHGIPAPQTIFPKSVDEAIELARQLRFPVLTKGIFDVDLAQKTGKRMFLIEKAQELRRLLGSHRESVHANFALQEFIPGGADASWMYNGYFDVSGNCLAEFTGRKIRQFPADCGMTSLGECARNDRVVQLARNMVKACGYKGCVDIDYSYDAREGQYKILDL